MPLIYVTGISGSGKSAVRDELLKRGYEAHGTDEDGLAAFYDRATDKITERLNDPEQRTPEWRTKHVWKMSRDKVEELAKRTGSKPIFLCGVAENDGDMADLFSKVVALVVDDKTLEHRISTRTTGNFGKNPHELATILEWQKTAENDYKQSGAVIVDATQPISKVVNEILDMINT